MKMSEGKVFHNAHALSVMESSLCFAFRVGLQESIFNIFSLKSPYDYNVKDPPKTQSD